MIYCHQHCASFDQAPDLPHAGSSAAYTYMQQTCTQGSCLPCWLSAWILFVLPTAYKLPYMNILLCGSLALPADAAKHTVMKSDGTNLVRFAGNGTSGSKWLYPLSFDAVMLKHACGVWPPTYIGYSSVFTCDSPQWRRLDLSTWPTATCNPALLAAPS